MSNEAENKEARLRAEKRDEKANVESKDNDVKWWRIGPRIRLIPIWLRLVIVFVLLFISLIIGLVFGYSLLGGGEPTQILRWETWQRLIDFVNVRE
ncbi:DNA-directed RNA polymerase subunit beta [Thalassorhabdus alkalitolerans]|uniref:DNA-directed RNA polymerase subunit beta n=1 Tax=Thalassorhabdus alkalitolerans TaxID=2282697 RepID=A0ABW0YJD0_9BACI|nr:DNA-directed RNA polymerase subunit beta [Thalassobacillus sp. C254]